MRALPKCARKNTLPRHHRGYDDAGANRANLCESSPLILPPHHTVNDAGVALDDLHDLGRDVLVRVIRHGRRGQRPLRVEGNRGPHGVQEPSLIDAGERKAALVERLGSLGARADAHSRERTADGGEEARLLGQGAGVRDHAEGVGLQAVVVVEAHGLVHSNKRVELKAGSLQALAAARVAAVENRLAVLLSERIDGREERAEVGLRVDVLLAVGRQQEVAARLQTLVAEHVRRVDLLQVRAQYLRHGRARHVGALRRAAGGGEIAPSVLRVSEVHVRDHVHDAAVGLLRQTLVLAAVARLHVEDGDVQALRGNRREARVRVSQHEQGVRLDLRHELVGGVDDVADGRAQVLPHRVHVDVRVVERQVAEEDAVQRVVVVLPGVREQAVEVAATLLDDLREADNLRSRAHDDEKL